VGRKPILFQEALKYLIDTTIGNTTNFVDVSPSGTMASLLKKHFYTKNQHRIFSILTSSLNETDNFSKITNNLGTNFAKLYPSEQKK
jgi:hypothetical protein